MVIVFIKDFKTMCDRCDINDIDFEAELKALHAEFRCAITSSYPEESGSETITEPGICVLYPSLFYLAFPV